MADSPDLAGTQLGRFRIKRLIGKGGMGEVYAAMDDSLDREVAIKVLGKAVNIEPHRRRFLREARLAARLNHPNIASIHEVGDSDGRLYIVMELLEGQSLRSILTARRLPETEALSIARDVARALARAHAGDVIHRDIKPENIFITHPSPDVMMAKVLDFGLARDELSRKRTDEESTATDLTGPGEACGTAGYLAPEQARGLAVDVRADIFSFGAVVYEMLTGQRAFDGRNQLARMLAVVKQEPLPMRSHVPELEIDPSFEAVIAKCLHKSPTDRFADGADLLSALEQVARTTSQRLLAAVDLSSRNLVPAPPSSASAVDSAPRISTPVASSKGISTVTPAPSIRSEPPRPQKSRRRAGGVVAMERPLWPFVVAGLFVLIGMTLIIVTIATRPSSSSTPSRLVASAVPKAASPPVVAAAANQPAGATDEAIPSASPPPQADEPPSLPSPSPSPSPTPAPKPHPTSSPIAKAQPTSAAFTKLPSPTPSPSPPPPAPPPPPVEHPKVGTVRLQQGQDVMTVVVDGEYRRVKENSITLSCGRHKIRVGFKDERIVDVPCGGSVSL